MNILLVIICLLLLSPKLDAQVTTVLFTADMPLVDSTSPGDYRKLATLVKQERKKNQNTLFLFGGGSLGPSPMSAFDKGAHIIDVLNSLEPDAMGVTKREFIYFEDELSLRSFEAAFPIVVSNVFDPITNGNIDGLRNYIVLERKGFKLGILSILDKSVINDYLLQRLEITAPLEAINNHIEALRSAYVDAVLVLYSYPFPFIDALLSEGKIDAAIMAYSQYVLPPNSQISHPQNIIHNSIDNVIKLTFERLPHRVAQNTPPLSIKHTLIPLDNYPTDPDVSMLVKGYSERLARLLDEEIGETAKPLSTRVNEVRTTENAFANFLTDSLRHYLGTDIAIVNGGAIRGDKTYPADHVFTRKDIAIELPFRTRVTEIKMTGVQILQAIEHGLSLIEAVKGRFLHISGMEITFDSSEPVGARLKTATINQQPVILDKTYRVATTSYLASGGDGHEAIQEGKITEEHARITPLLTDVLIRGIRSERRISPSLDGRLIDVGGNHSYH
ncbi:5'-nucleotidase C-terminal domain-containing protein [Aestuariibacter sp. AA17]|uniref:5'-nucleotidase C-terminal domain-containing protein n=1 Tax=Fluctibacter corallii TaxID=2984329 RepID=A0ABT3A730_9ALTE|nr:5'-nucleotidase C-terminal domain-containing protein [Aestuariibacter sp. AA17]MCV2884468.1 5'-nucleotidase C-terminal domain-containing protein [Aestuariibacter sp. AA17]